MSDNWLRYVPSDPWFHPDLVAAEKARTQLSTLLPEAEKICTEFYDRVVFIDAGGNWSGVFCPLCETDAEPWWADCVSDMAARGFSSLEVIAPCCGAKVSLNELNYVWPVAFASFELSAMNANAKSLSTAQLQELERVLGVSLREIAQHL